MSYFNFNGSSSEAYGLKIVSMPPPSRGGNETESITIPGRPEQLNKIHGEYENTELKFECVITNPSLLRSIFKWLNGSGQLIYSDESDKYYNVISNDIIEVVRVSDEIRSFTVRFLCSPFAYAVENTSETTVFNVTDVSRTASMTINNNGSMYCEPLFEIGWAGRLKITVNGGESLYIDNVSKATYTDTKQYTGSYSLPGDPITYSGIYRYTYPLDTIFIDVSRRIAYQILNNVKIVTCELTEGKFPTLRPGLNTIEFEIFPTNNSILDNVFKHDVNGATRLYKPYNQQFYRIRITKNERWL